MKDKYSAIHYHNYLGLDKILNAQDPRSANFGDPAHDEMLFIIIHQVYELWFKQILHELSSIGEIFSQESVPERQLGKCIHMCDRIIEIQKLLIQQIRVLETMTSLDFLEFRDYLFPASGFQSFQFRVVEAMLGLKDDDRITYGGHSYLSPFDKEKQDEILDAGKKNLFDLIEKWLERTPFLKKGDFNFRDRYETAVRNMINRETESINNSTFLDEGHKKMRLLMLGNTESYYRIITDKSYYDELKAEGGIRLSYKALLAALLINLYRDHPMLTLPYNLLRRIMEIDESFTIWRFRHAQMVLRMLGKKIGTGGSSGHDYLAETAEKHVIFKDFHNISTLLIPRSDIPPLPEGLIRELDFHFSFQTFEGND